MFMTFLLIGVVLLMVEAAIPGFGIFGVTGLCRCPAFFDPCPRLLVLSQRPA